MDNYFSTSEFAEIFNISRQALLFYDKKDLFKPEYRDENNSYRKYSHNQLAQFSFIMYLRTIGFSIDKIRTIMQCNDIDHTIEQLRFQSEALKAQYAEIFKIDTIIQRKLTFVRDKLNAANFDEITRTTCAPKAYVKIGNEHVLYESENFYYFPTIVLYEYQPQDRSYNKTFAAYMDTEESQTEHLEQLHYTKEEDCLCLYHKGPYDRIPETVAAIRQQHRDLPLADDFLCINIIDQFLETDPQKFITEIQIPLNGKTAS